MTALRDMAQRAFVVAAVLLLASALVVDEIVRRWRQS